MVEKTKQFIEVENEIKELCMSTMCNEDMLKAMDSTTLKLMQLSLKLMDASNEVLLEQAKMITEIHENISYLIKRGKES